MARNRGHRRGRKRRRSLASQSDDNNGSSRPHDVNPSGDGTNGDDVSGHGVGGDVDTNDANPSGDGGSGDAGPDEQNQAAVEALPCIIHGCFDALFDADDLDEDTVELWQSAEASGIDQTQHSIEEATLLLGLRMVGLTAAEEIHKLLYAKLLGPLQDAVAMQHATPYTKKLQFLTDANVGVGKNKKRGKFIHRNHLLPDSALVADMIVTAFFLSAIGRLRYASNEVLPNKALNVWPPGAAEPDEAPPQPLSAPPTGQEAGSSALLPNPPDSQPQGPTLVADHEWGSKTNAPAPPATPIASQKEALQTQATRIPTVKNLAGLAQVKLVEKATEPLTPTSGRDRKRRRLQKDFGDHENPEDQQGSDESPVPFNFTLPSSSPAVTQPAPVWEGLSPPSEGVTAERSLGEMTLEALIASSPSRIKIFCNDRGVDVDDDITNAALYAKAIMLMTGANKLVSVGSQLESVLREAMPPTGWTARVAVQQYGEENFAFWTDCGNATENLYRIVQGLLAREGVISVPDMNGELVPVGVPTFTITRSFSRLFGQGTRHEDKHSGSAYHFRFIDWNLAEFGIYNGQPLFQTLDRRLRPSLTRRVLNQRKTAEFLYRLGIGVVHKKTERKTKVLQPVLTPWDLKIIARGAVLPVDFVVALWILQAIGHARLEGRNRQPQEEGAADRVSVAQEESEEHSPAPGPPPRRRRRPIPRHVVIADSGDED